MQRPIYYPSIDGLRFFAFVFIFFRHFKTNIPFPFLHRDGWLGVELFFLISAFLLTRLLRKEYEAYGSIQVRNFYVRRILRIWPLYFFYLLAITIYNLKVGPDYFFPDRLAGNVFFYDNILSAFDFYNQNLFSMHLWSISMEEQYYLLLPFAIPWLMKSDRRKVITFFLILFLLMVAGRIIATAANKPHPFIYVLPISGDSFLAGMILGLGIFEKYINRIRSIPAFVIAILLMASLHLIPTRLEQGYHQVYVYIIAALGFSLLLISLLNKPGKLLSSIFTVAPVRYLGKISYGLYIYHFVAIYVAGRLCEKLDLNMKDYHLALTLFLNIGMAILSYELFEKFVLKYKRKFTLITNRQP
jgi:peptidoglycan/LPS O-acetylase OafA/YrhL